MNKIIDLFRKYSVLRILFLKAFKLFSLSSRFYQNIFFHKRKSKEIFQDAALPIGGVRLSILKGLGIPEKELRRRPLIAVCNSYTEINPGHKHLKQLAESVKAGIYAAGGLPFEFGVPGPCDGIGNGNEGMRYILPQRDLIADIIEMYIKSQWFDGLVTISSCDKINPAMLMAAARLDIPVICVAGGPNMMKIRFTPQFKGIDHKEYERLSDKILTATSATCGACELMTTANTMQLLMEALGIAIPYSACIPAFSSEKMEYAYKSGERIVEMVKENLIPSKILTRESLENAVMVCLAIGGSTNAALHLPALAQQLGIDLDIRIFNKFNQKIPLLCNIAPHGPYGVYDLFIAGGIPAVMKRLKNFLHLNSQSVCGETIGDIIKKAEVKNEEVIRPLSSPVRKEGGIVALFGNLAPEGAVVKQSAVKEDYLKFTGYARVFESEQETLLALVSGKVKKGEVIVIRNEGPKGGPGMPEMLSVTASIDLLGLEEVALVTDGRFSGATSGPCVGHISPESFVGGPIAALKDGDVIKIDIPSREIKVELEDTEIKRRLENLKPIKREIKKGYQQVYQKLVSSASNGAIIL